MIGTELAKVIAMIGKKAIWRVDGMKVPVNIVDVKLAYGRVRYLISNEYGVNQSWNGETKWVDESAIVEMSTSLAKTALHAVKELFMP